MLEAKLSPQVTHVNRRVTVKVVGIENGIEGRNQRDIVAQGVEVGCF